MWETVIGLETHAQLATASKIFSGSSTAFGAAPNTHANAVDMALPGVLPVCNVGAVECAIRFGLSVGATLNRTSIFARKNYFYPDLPKGYQISQYEIPVVAGGSVTIQTEKGVKTVRLTRAHLEEDAGKSLHEDYHGMTGIDLNRAGTPLLEIVTEPDMSSAEEAVAYAKALHTLVQWIGICDGNMQEGSFRCDANVSVRRKGEPLGTRCEIKNLNSFRFLEKAIEYEVRRQIELIEDGGQVVQETRLFDPDKGETRSMRSKEDAQDYRYFPDPDLPPLFIDDEWIDRVKAELPELPDAMNARFIQEYQLPEYDAALLTASLPFARYFERIVGYVGVKNAKTAANWMIGELSAALNRDGVAIENCPVTAPQLAAVIDAVVSGVVSNKGGKDLFQKIWEENSGDIMQVRADEREEERADVGEFEAEKAQLKNLIEKLGLQQISDTGAIEKIIDDVLAQQQAIVEEYRAGKQKAFNSLVGQIMKASKGKANPAQVNEMLRKKLG